MTTDELRHHLLTLSAECAAASLAGLDHSGPCIDKLRAEIALTHSAFVAVTEIASFRAQLSGPPIG